MMHQYRKKSYFNVVNHSLIVNVGHPRGHNFIRNRTISTIQLRDSLIQSLFKKYEREFHRGKILLQNGIRLIMKSILLYTLSLI